MGFPRQEYWSGGEPESQVEIVPLSLLGFYFWGLGLPLMRVQLVPEKTGLCVDFLGGGHSDSSDWLVKLRCWFQSSVSRPQNAGDLEHVIAFGSGGLRLRPQPCEYSCAVWCNVNSETTLQFHVPPDPSRGLWMLFTSVYFEVGWTEYTIRTLLFLLTVFPTFISHHSRVLFCQPDFSVVPSSFPVIICWFPYVWKIHYKWLKGKMCSSPLKINSSPHPTPILIFKKVYIYKDSDEIFNSSETSRTHLTLIVFLAEITDVFLQFNLGEKII